jgi:Uncharacterized conserved protein
MNAKWKDTLHLLRRLELGLIFVSFKKGACMVEIVQEPEPFDRERSIKLNKGKRKRLLKEIEGRNLDLNKGGSRGKKLVTSYRESALFIACCFNMYGSMSPKKLRQLGSDEKKTLSILAKNHYGWFQKLGRGLYGITEEGVKALEEYSELTAYYKENLIKPKGIQET